ARKPLTLKAPGFSGLSLAPPPGESERRSDMLMRTLKALAALALVVAIAGPAAALAASRAVSEQQELVNAARVTFSRFGDDPDQTGFREHERQALGSLHVLRAGR